MHVFYNASGVFYNASGVQADRRHSASVVNFVILLHFITAISLHCLTLLLCCMLYCVVSSIQQ
jgi:hypothetical protein